MFILKILAFAALAVAAFLALGWVVMRLWNWLVPGAFNGPRLQYKYALGLLVLSRLLFGGGFHGGFHGGYGHPGGRHHAPWHQSQPKPGAAPKPTPAGRISTPALLSTI